MKPLIDLTDERFLVARHKLDMISVELRVAARVRAKNVDSDPEYLSALERNERYWVGLSVCEFLAALGDALRIPEMSLPALQAIRDHYRTEGPYTLPSGDMGEDLDGPSDEQLDHTDRVDDARAEAKEMKQ